MIWSSAKGALTAKIQSAPVVELIDVSRFLSPALSEVVRASVHLEDVDVVGQAVEKRAGEMLLAECGGPLVEAQVRGNDGGAPLVALADPLADRRMRSNRREAARTTVLRRSLRVARSRVRR